MLSEVADEGMRALRRGDGSTIRTCALTRAERPTDELIRFVAGPDGQIVPDLAQRLPGRGVWITACRTDIVAAVKAKAFARGLKRHVTAPPDLADQVEWLLERRVADALSLANKAGEVVAGFAKIETAITSGATIALLHALEAAEDGRNKLDRRLRGVNEAQGRPVAILTCLTIDQMSLALGRANVVHAALTEGGAARRAMSEAERLTRFRSRVGPFSTPGADGSPDAETDKV